LQVQVFGHQSNWQVGVQVSFLASFDEAWFARSLTRTGRASIGYQPVGPG
jgi:hypothetical protein